MKSNRSWSFFRVLPAFVLFITACSQEGTVVEPRTLTSIAVTPTQDSIADGTSAVLTATGTFSDGSIEDLTASASWSSSDQNVATVNAGSATGVSIGSAIITAGDIASGVSGSMMIDVTAAILTSIQVTPPNPSIALGTTQAFTATGIYTDMSSGDLTSSVTFLASDPSIISLTGATAQSLSVGTSEVFTAICTYSDNSTQDLTDSVTWLSSDTALTTISNVTPTQGHATSVGVGAATITAAHAASGTSGNTTLTVTPAVLVTLAITPTNPSIALGTNQVFTAVGTFSDSTTQDLTTALTWSSSDIAVATVSNASGSHGVATSVSAGSSTITALDVASGINDAVTFTVTNAMLTSIAVTPVNPSIALGTTENFTAIGTFSDQSTQDLTSSVTWSSSDTNVVSVSNASPDNGLATSLATGSASIIATDASSGTNGSTTLTVTAAVLTTIAVTPASASLALGTSDYFIATGTFSDGSTQDLTTAVTWFSSDPAVATVSNAFGSEGLATSVAIGSLTLTATEPTSSVSGSTTLTVSPAVLSSIAISPAFPSFALGTRYSSRRQARSATARRRT